VLELDRRIEAAVPTRSFGVRSGGATVAYASLYLDGEVAEIEDVATRESHRGRGYATAVVLRAVTEAPAAGAKNRLSPNLRGRGAAAFVPATRL
jgi:predicted GNAT family acetyltransferase